MTLSAALRRKEWELAALFLLLGLAEAMEKLPADGVEGLLEVLDGGKEGPEASE